MVSRDKRKERRKRLVSVIRIEELSFHYPILKQVVIQIIVTNHSNIYTGIPTITTILL